MPRDWSRMLLTTATTCVLALLGLVAAQGQPPQFDPERGFAFGDADLDGKLSLDEFRDLALNGPRLKNANAAARKSPALVEPVFRRLDTNQDQFLTMGEYLRINQFRPGGGPLGGGPLAKKGAFGPFAKKRGLAARKPSEEARPRPETAPARPVTAEQAKFFETKIRPVLMTSCAECHAQGAKKVQGGLRVDSREGLLKGGDTGPAVVPGNLDDSLLITAIRFDDEGLQMPPKKRLPPEVVADFETWIKMGAPDPRTGAPSATASNWNAPDIARGRAFWSFQPPRAATPPPVKDAAWPRTDLDRFLLAALEAKGLKPVGDADRATLLRRLTFDLTGLPPTPEEVEAFLADPSDDALTRVVDRLLASPRFGERWGRHWLDVARFAESSGKANMLYSQAWRYRDWVIAAVNDDLPYDQFVMRQIAGDLLPAKTDAERARNLIATGFLALGSKTHNTQNRIQFVLDLADEQIDTTSQAFLGLTVACARCHDHKFDPIPQRDYYALSGIFQSTQTCYGTLPGVIQNLNPSPLIELPAKSGASAGVPPLPPDRRDDLESQLAALIKTRDSLTPEETFTPKGIQTRTRLAMVKFRLASYQPDGTPRSYAMGVRERFEPVNSPLYTRGEIEHPGEAVPRGLVQVVSKGTPPPIRSGSGRLELAQWLAARDNPLTARVMVNRVWLHLFGRGLVPTPDNFGASGQPPSHPALLDTLAVSFMNDGWSVKKLIRRIVLSRAYQLASTHDARNFEADPENTLVWRMSKKRLEAEAIRDALLAVSGRLELDPPVGSAVAVAGEGPVGPLRNFSQDALDYHRAVYLPVVRDQLPESLTLFDFADPSFVNGERATTSGPSQALFLMNNPFVIRQSEFAAEEIETAGHESDPARVEAAYLRFLGRKPTASERARGADFLEHFRASGKAERRHAAMTAFCQALFASAEFRYLD